MKKCPECRQATVFNHKFCNICGSKLGLPDNTRCSRLLLLILPFFLILGIVTLSYELGVVSPVDNGLATGGFLVLVYMLSAIIFRISVVLFRLPSLPESVWQAGILSVIHLIFCILLTFIIDESYIHSFMKNAALPNYYLYHLRLASIIYIPTLLTEFLAISARVRIASFPESAKSPYARFFLKYSIFMIPLIIALLTIMIYVTQSFSVKSVIKSRLYYELHAHEKALDTINSSLKEYEYAPLYFMKSLILLDYPDNKYSNGEIIINLEKAIKLNDNFSSWYYYLGIAYDSEKRESEAISALIKASEKKKDSVEIWELLGQLYLKYRRYPEAIKAFETALNLSPDNPILLNNMAYTMLETNNKISDALSIAKRSVELMPNHIFNLDTLAWAYFKSGQNAEALEIMNKIFHGQSEISPEVDFHYARILLEEKMLANPLQALDRLLTKPEVAANYHLFQQIYSVRKQVEKSMKSAEGTSEASMKPNITLSNLKSNKKSGDMDGK